MRHGFKAWLVCSTATAAALWTPAALAQESGTDSGETQSEAATTARGAAAALESEDIVVTALKRSDNLQTVPVAISAYGERSEEHTSELQSLMRISYAVFCLKKKITTHLKKSRQLNRKNK